MSNETIGLSISRRRQIEGEANALLRNLWRQIKPPHPLDVVNPGLALEHLGFQVRSEDLGIDYIDGQLVQVAGVINTVDKEVCISTRPTRDEQFFTAAHELAHAILHPEDSGLHRDRPTNGPSMRKDYREAEADYFASCFLMPRRQLLRSFVERFDTEDFVLDSAASSALCDVPLWQARTTIKNRRDLSRLLAECTSFDGRAFTSLKYEYQVSTLAMAIRLEETGLVGKRALQP